ncbi:MAG TPA: hypothetical protein VGP01_06460 [Rhizomicrobium sp.]|jgi:hypothetical protein|nr:hypothetical protein [Rhizomicrobium sp.]
MSDDPPDELFAREFQGVLEKYYALKEARQKHPYVGDLIAVLLPFPAGLRRALVIYELEKQRKQDGLPIPASFEAAVQNSYNHYSEDSEVFRKREAPSAEGLFYSPDGKGSGRWAVHPDRALQWLKARLGDPKLL